MEIDEIFEKYNIDTMCRMQAIFTSLFILQNRMQTAGEKLQTEISMKQWLLLTITEICPKPRTLSNVGKIMGCSRQNVKKLALSLEKKGFIRLLSESNNSVCIELTEKVDKYSQEIGEQQVKALKLLFENFSEKEIEQLFDLYKKLYLGIKKVEKYTKKLNDEKSNNNLDIREVLENEKEII